MDSRRREEESQGEDGGLAVTAERLDRKECFWRSHHNKGRTDALVSVVRSDHRYSLVIVGDVFTSRVPSIRVRLKREMAGSLRETHRRARDHRGGASGEISFWQSASQPSFWFSEDAPIALFLLVLTHQESILDFLAGPEWKGWRIVATVGIALFVPLFAYLYGSASGLIFKLMKFR